MLQEQYEDLDCRVSEAQLVAERAESELAQAVADVARIKDEIGKDARAQPVEAVSGLVQQQPHHLSVPQARGLVAVDRPFVVTAAISDSLVSPMLLGDGAQA